MFNKTIENFLNNFRNKTIKPTDWDKVVFAFNMKYIAIESVIILLLTGGILSAIINPKFSFIIALVVVIILILLHKQKFSNFLEVPVGSIGIITLLGEVKGSIKENNQYHLVPGKYRDIIDILFYKNIFNIILPPTRYNNFDFKFKDVFSKDGVAIEGTHTGRPQLVDPWAWTNLLLASNDYNIHYEKIEDISLEAMNNSADNMTIREILKTNHGGGDGSDNFKKEYLKELNDLIQLLPYKKPFLSDIEWEREAPITEIDGERKYKKFFFPETGLNVTFNIKTRSPMDKKMREALAAEALAKETKRAVEINAEAEKIRLGKEGEGKAMAEKAMADATATAYEEAFKKYRKLKLSKEVAAQKAALSANLYASEIITEIGNSDGSPISGGRLDLIKILALAKGLWKGGDK